MSDPPLILIIEDDDTLRATVRAVFEGKGWKVDDSGSMLEGIRKAEKYKPKLTLLDLSLPDSKGIETLKTFRAFCPTSTVVVVTGEVALGRAATLEGAMDYLTKPVESATLLDRAERAMDRAEVWVFAPLRDRIDQLITELESNKAEHSVARLEPPTKEIPPLRDGKSTFGALIAIVLMIGSMFFGYEFGRHSERSQRLQVVGNPGEREKSARTSTAFDSNLAELRQHPTLAAVMYFDTIAVVPDRRAEVVEALAMASACGSKSARFQACETLKKWRDDGH